MKGDTVIQLELPLLVLYNSETYEAFFWMKTKVTRDGVDVVHFHQKFMEKALRQKKNRLKPRIQKSKKIALKQCIQKKIGNKVGEEKKLE